MSVLTWPGAADLPQLPFRRLFTPLNRLVPENAGIVTAYTDGQVTLRSNRSKIGYHEAADLSGYQGVEQGDFVVHGLDILRGSVGVADSSGAISSVCTVCKPIASVEPRYVAYAIRLQSESGYPKALARGVRQGGADFRRWDTLAELPIPSPPVEVQRRVADFLDRETAEIDAFIADQRQLIGLLAERRAATISHAVTNGLDPTVPMKDSGFDGVTQIPEHWTMFRLKNLGSIRYGIGEPPAYTDDGVPLIRATNVSAGRITPARLAFVNPDDIPASRIFWLQFGDIIVVRSGALTGDSAIIPREYESAIAGFDMVFRAGNDTDPQFIQYALLASYVKNDQLEVASTRAAQPHLNAQELGNTAVACAPLEEQQRIAEWLDRETTDFDAMIADAKESIALSRERRAALISAAVTGKIDVRERQ